MEKQVYSIEYEVKNKKTGEVVDSNYGQEPLEFINGNGHIIEGLEEAVVGMNVGEEKTVDVPADKAYGQYDESLTQILPREQFEGIDLQKGMTLYGQGPDGQVITVTVKDFDDKNVTIDYNHPLAGADLEFKVKLVSKRNLTETEKQSGQVDKLDHCGAGCGCHH